MSTWAAQGNEIDVAENYLENCLAVGSQERSEN